MPARDGTGPAGYGPMTGRGLGPCGRGTGFRRGPGRGFWCPRTYGYFQPTKEEEVKLLESEKTEIEAELKDIEARIKELKEKK